MKIFSILIILFYSSVSLSQNLKFEDIPSNKMLFIGEMHYIKENYPAQLELIKEAVDKYSYNAVFLELASGYQAILDNIKYYNDTSNFYLVEPTFWNNDYYEKNDFSPYLEFLHKLMDLSREKDIEIFCVDTEPDYNKTKRIILSIADTSYTRGIESKNIFQPLKESGNKQKEIWEQLMKLYESERKWKSLISKPSYHYIERILSNIHLKTINGFSERFFDRNEYMYNQINSIFKQNKKLKAIGIFGIGHTHKKYAPNLKLPNWTFMKNSIASYLNENKNSVCRGRVSSIALINYFNSGKDSTYTSMYYFLNDDLRVIKDALSKQKYYISKTSNIPISPYLKEAFDYIVAINDCHKIITKSWYYFKPSYDEIKNIEKQAKDSENSK